MSFIFNLLAKAIIILMLVFVVITLIFVIWYYAELLLDAFKEKRKKSQVKQCTKLDNRSIIEQLDEAFGRKNGI